MQMLVLFATLFVTVILKFTVLGIPVTNSATPESCDVRFTTYDFCSGSLSVNLNCTSSFFNLTDSYTSEACEWTNFFWSYPMNNLTIIVETPYTAKRQNYEIRLSNDRMMASIEHVYRLIDGKEIDVTTKESILDLKSDSNYQVVIKLQAPSRMYAYGVYIVYQVVESKKNLTD